LPTPEASRKETQLRTSDTEVLFPTSAAEAVQVFGDGHGVTVFAGARF